MHTNEEIAHLAMAWVAARRVKNAAHECLEHERAKAIVAGRSHVTDPAAIAADTQHAAACRKEWLAEAALEKAAGANLDAVLGSARAAAANDTGAR